MVGQFILFLQFLDMSASRDMSKTCQGHVREMSRTFPTKTQIVFHSCHFWWSWQNRFLHHNEIPGTWNYFLDIKDYMSYKTDSTRYGGDFILVILNDTSCSLIWDWFEWIGIFWENVPADQAIFTSTKSSFFLCIVHTCTEVCIPNIVVSTKCLKYLLQTCFEFSTS